jgi:hypothetical protein
MDVVSVLNRNGCAVQKEHGGRLRRYLREGFGRSRPELSRVYRILGSFVCKLSVIYAHRVGYPGSSCGFGVGPSRRSLRSNATFLQVYGVSPPPARV